MKPILWLPPALAVLVWGLVLSLGLPKWFQEPYSTVMWDRHGQLAAASLAADGQWRFPPLKKAPDKFARAVVAFEDKRFYHHFGFDPLALARAAWLDVKAGHVVSGGSTLTMQVVRLALKDSERTFGNKLWETLLAIRLELADTKPQILALYASYAPFGGNIVGISAASWRYFGRAPQDLSWAEAAFLAVLPNAPSSIHPGLRQASLKKKRDGLLRRLYHEKQIDRETLRLSLLEPLPNQVRPFPHSADAFEHFTEAQHGGTSWVSSLDLDLQREVERVQGEYQKTLLANGIENSAVLVADTQTGEVLAYSANSPLSGTPGGDNDMIQAPRSSGSTLKPFLYASMMDSGQLTPERLVLDIPTRMGSFVPLDNTRTYLGAVSAAEALERSLNIPATRELQEYGISRFYSQLKSLGFTTLFRTADDYGLPLIIGGAEVRLWELAGAYAGLARRALGHAWPEASQASAFFPLSEVPRAQVALKKGTSSEPTSVGGAYLAIQAMKELARPGTENDWKNFSSSRKIAWKTGTSQGYRDAWAIGVTPEYTVGIWIGNADGEGRPDLLGFRTAAPLLFSIYNILGPTSWFSEPWGAFKIVNLCQESGYLAGPNCLDTISEALPKDAPLPALCPYHLLLHLDVSETHQVDSRSYPVSKIKNVPWFVLPPAVEYYYRPHHLEYRPPPPFLPGSADSDQDSPLALVFPVEGAHLYIPIELDGTPGKTTLQATHRDPQATIFWSLDGVFIGSTVGIHQMDVRPGMGRHTLDLWDSEGHHLRRHFFVLSHK